MTNLEGVHFRSANSVQNIAFKLKYILGVKPAAYAQQDRRTDLLLGFLLLLLLLLRLLGPPLRALRAALLQVLLLRRIVGFVRRLAINADFFEEASSSYI